MYYFKRITPIDDDFRVELQLSKAVNLKVSEEKYYYFRNIIKDYFRNYRINLRRYTFHTLSVIRLRDSLVALKLLMDFSLTSNNRIAIIVISQQ